MTLFLKYQTQLGGIKGLPIPMLPVTQIIPAEGQERGQDHGTPHSQLAVL